MVELLLQVALGVFALLVYGRFVLWFYHWRNKHDQRRFVMLLQITFPRSTVTYVTAEGTEKEALKVLKHKFMEGEAEES